MPASAAVRAGTLSISPALIDAVLAPRSPLPAVSVVNRTKYALRIRVYPALVHQGLDGGLIPRTRPRELRAARRLFSLSPSGAVLEPGGSVLVHGRFIRTAGGPGAYAAAVITATPPTTKGRIPPFRLRLFGALLIVKPGAPPPRGRIVAIRVAQVGKRHLVFRVRVRNTGTVHGYATGVRVRLVDPRGRTIFVGAPRPGVVLPRYQRDLRVDLGRRLRSGTYLVRATGRFGKQAIGRATFFRILASGRIASARPS